MDVPPRPKVSGTAVTSQRTASATPVAPRRSNRRPVQQDPHATTTIHIRPPRTPKARSPVAKMDVDQAENRLATPADVSAVEDQDSPEDTPIVPVKQIRKPAAPRGGAGRSRRNPSAKFEDLDEQTNDPDARYSWNRDLHEIAFRRHSQTITDEMIQVANIGVCISLFIFQLSLIYIS